MKAITLAIVLNRAATQVYGRLRNSVLVPLLELQGGGDGLGYCLADYTGARVLLGVGVLNLVVLVHKTVCATR